MSEDATEPGGPPRCRLCGEVIGVYEPIVVIGDERPVRTSRAAMSEHRATGDCFHVSCFAEDGPI